MKILIVEDDVNISKMIEVTLNMGGYEYHTVHDGIEAMAEIKTGRYSLILLDVMLPGIDGFSIMEQIRPMEIPVIFLTAKQEVTDKVMGLRLGAEDYIVKPFETMELLARVEVVLRRVHKDNHCVNYRNIVVDMDKHAVFLDGEPVALTPKEFDVLLFFLKHQDIVIRKEQLMGSIWGFDFIGETRTVDTHVQQVRKKLRLQEYLLTIPKIGYRLINGE